MPPVKSNQSPIKVLNAGRFQTPQVLCSTLRTRYDCFWLSELCTKDDNLSVHHHRTCLKYNTGTSKRILGHKKETKQAKKKGISTQKKEKSDSQ